MNAEPQTHPFMDRPAERRTATLPAPDEARLSGQKVFVAGQVSCISSRINVKRYADFVVAHGGVETEDLGQADIVLVDTCATNESKEEASLHLIKENEAGAKDGAKVIVVGCLAGINPRKLRESFNGDFFSPKNEDQLAQILGLDQEEAKFLGAFEPRGRFMGGSDFIAPSWVTRLLVPLCTMSHRIDNRASLHWIPWFGKLLDSTQAGNPRAYAMTISQGCMGNCSFCVIPLAKGTTQSMPMANLLAKIEKLVESGVTKILLTSEDTGAYGKDIDTTIVDFLRHVNKLPGKFALYINFFDPRWLRSYWKDLLPVLAEGRVRYIQLPLQSGNNAVLNRMRRAYQIEHVLPIIREFKARLPRLDMATQMIVGFPGETEEQFQDTRRVLREGLFDYVEVFPYSERPGADSTRLTGQLPKEVTRRRAAKARRDWVVGKLAPFARRPLELPVKA